MSGTITAGICPPPPDRVVLTGGGAANLFLAAAIQREVQAIAPKTDVTTSAALGWPLQSVEPAAFALLAYLRMTGQPGNIPQTTGALRAARLGQVAEF